MNKQTRVIFSIILTAAMLLTFLPSATVAAETDPVLDPRITIVINGEIKQPVNVNGDPVYPILHEGTTYLPVRGISYLFSKSVSWDGNTQTVAITDAPVTAPALIPAERPAVQTLRGVRPDRNIKITYNGAEQQFANVNGVPVYPILYNGTTYIPVRGVAAMFGKIVDWDGAARAVLIDNSIYAQFKTPILENWVRETLNKSADDQILLTELDSIKQIGFVINEAVKDFDIRPGYGQMGISSIYGNFYDRVGFDFYDLNEFAQFRNLETLMIIGQQITDISPLANLKNLKRLDLTYNHVSDISPLKDLPIEKLRLEANPISDISVIPTLSLHELYMRDTRITSIAALRGMYLSELHLDHNKIADLAPLSTMRLGVLSIRGIENVDFSFVEDSGVAYLEISDLTDAQAASLSGAKLEGLRIYGMNNNRGQFPELAIPGLKNIRFSHGYLNNLDFIKDCVGLEGIEIWDVVLHDISALSSMPNLQRVAIQYSEVRDVSVLRGLSKLDEVILPSSSRASYESFASSVNWTPNFRDGGFQNWDPRIGKINRSVYAQQPPTALQSAPPRYISLTEANRRTYNKDIITDAMLAAPTNLPDATNSKLPYWVGPYMDGSWLCSVYEGMCVVGFEREWLLEMLAENGLNRLCLIYSFSRLHKPGDVNMIDEAELERLDELISWGIKHGIHMQISMIELPDMWGVDHNSTGIIGSEAGVEYFGSREKQIVVENLWAVLASRYAAISNKYLSFELYCEPNYGENYQNVPQVVRSLTNAIWQAEGNKSENDRRVLILQIYGETDEHGNTNDIMYDEVGKIGCAINITAYYSFRITVGPDKSYPYNPPMDEFPYYLERRIDRGEDYAVTIKGEEIFPAGTVISIFVRHSPDSGALEILADGGSILRQNNLQEWTREKGNEYSVTLTSAASTLQVMNVTPNDVEGVIDIHQITVKMPGKPTVHLVPHSLHWSIYDNKNQILTIKRDLSVVSNKNLDGEWFFNSQILPKLRFAQKHNLGIMIFETFGGIWSPHSYEIVEIQAKVLQQHQIAWTPDGLVNGRAEGMMEYKDTGFFIDIKLANLLRRYARQ